MSRAQKLRVVSSIMSDIRRGAEPACSSFLGIPFELRLLIYEFLFLSPDRIVISPGKRQIRPKYRDTLRRGSGSPPAYFEVGPNERLAVQFLRTCKQINAEGTAVLYSRNTFLIGREQNSLHHPH